MLGLGESCSRCKSNGGIVNDSVAKKISCSECGLDFGLSIVITEPSNGSYDDFLSLKLGNSQHRGSDPVSISNDITEPSNASSDDFLSLSLGFSRYRASDPVAAMSNRLGLLETVKNQAIEISEKVKNRGNRIRNVHFAACIFVACRQSHMSLTIDEISSVADGASVSLIRKAIHSIAAKLGLQLHTLLPIRAAEFVKRFCSTLNILDSQDVRAAEAYPHFVHCGRSALSVAAVIVYVIARVSYEKRLLKGIMDATGVTEDAIKGTYKDLYQYLPAITPKWFANTNDLKKLGSP